MFLISILICDDDKQTIESITRLISKWEANHPSDFKITTSTNADELIYSQNLIFDIAFIDVEMPGINGLTLSEQIKKNNEDALVFIVTSFQNYLDSAMKIKVFRYLSKPIDENRFYLNFEDAIKEHLNASKTIVVKEGSSVNVVKTKDILFIEGKKRGANIVTKSHTYATSSKLAYWYEAINQPDVFTHSHTSYVVNLQNVLRFDKENVYFNTSNGEIKTAYMSGRRYNAFKKSFMQFIGDKL